MTEKWAIAMEPCGNSQGRFVWVRDESGEIALFPSQGQARLWLLKEPLVNKRKNEIVFVRIAGTGTD